MSTKAEYGLQTEAGLYIDIEQAQNTTSTNLSKRTVVIGSESEYPGELDIQSTLINNGPTTGAAGYSNYDYEITAESLYDGTEFTGADVQWTMTSSSGVSKSGTGTSGTESLPSETVSMTVTAGIDSIEQTTSRIVTAPGAIGTAGTNVSMSQIATIGGRYFFSMPGDWESNFWKTGTTPTVADGAMLYNVNGWRLGYSYNSAHDIQWYDNSTDFVRTSQAPFTHYFAKNAHTGSTGTTGNPVPFVNASECHPSVYNGVNMGCVYSWTPPKLGTVRIVGTVYDSNSAGGNGVLFWMAKLDSLNAAATQANIVDGEFIVPAQDTRDETYVSFDRTVEITSLTQPITLFIGPNGQQDYDTTVVRLNIWYTDVDMTGSNLSLRDMTETGNNFKVAMPRFVDDSGDPIQGPMLGTGNSDIKMSYHKDTFITPNLVKLDETNDTLRTAAAGDAFLKVQLLAPPTSTSTTEFRLQNAVDPEKAGQTVQSTWERDWTSADGSQSVTWTSLRGGVYGVEAKISKPVEVINGITNPAYTFTMDSNRLHPGITFIDRGILAYI